MEDAARTLTIDIDVLEARAETLEQTIHVARARKSTALLVLGSPVFAAAYETIATAAIRDRLPSIGLFPNFPRAGGLLGYGPDSTDQYRQEGRIIARILKGMNPAELPIERPSRFYLFVNLKTAKALGITIPPSVLLRADQVLE